MKKLFSVLFLCLVTLGSFAQEEQALKEAEESVSDKVPELNLGADLVSRYIWRGIDYGNSPAFQPNVYFSWSGLNFGFWGSYAFASHSIMINDTTIIDAGNYSEMDFYISYTYKWFTLMAFDYFCPNPIDPNYTDDKYYQYFNFDQKTTGHTVELSLAFAGPDAFPIKFLASTLVYGADKAKDSTGYYADPEKQNFSTYLELAYPVTFKTIDLNFFAGGSLFGSGWYGPKAGLINVGFTAKKSIPVTKNYGIPVQVSVVTNPAAQRVFLTFGISF
jgi:hypothetical protein